MVSAEIDCWSQGRLEFARDRRPLGKEKVLRDFRIAIVGWGVGMGLFRDLDLRPVTRALLRTP